MKNIITFMGKTPQIEEDVYIDPSSRIIGDVLLKKGCSIWPMCVLRADSSQIVIEDEAAVLDKVLMEAPANNPVVVGRRALISHGAILHGCTVQEGALVGIGAIILDGAVVRKGSVIGAGSVVSPQMVIPENSLVLGIPGRVVRTLKPDEVKKTSSQVDEVRQKADQYRANLVNLWNNRVEYGEVRAELLSTTLCTNVPLNLSCGVESSSTTGSISQRNKIV